MLSHSNCPIVPAPPFQCIMYSEKVFSPMCNKRMSRPWPNGLYWTTDTVQNRETTTAQMRLLWWVESKILIPLSLMWSKPIWNIQIGNYEVVNWRVKYAFYFYFIFFSHILDLIRNLVDGLGVFVRKVIFIIYTWKNNWNCDLKSWFLTV